MLEWQKSLGGQYQDIGETVIQTNDGGYFIVGNSESNDGDVTGHHGAADGTSDVWVVKLNSSGQIQWQKSLGGTSWEYGMSVVETDDEDLVICGRTASIDGDVTGHHGPNNDDVWVVKLDASGNLIWSKCFGGTGYDAPEKIVAAADGGYLITGVANSLNGDVTEVFGNFDIWLIKIDVDGNLTWQRSFGSTNDDRAFGVISEAADRYVLAGYTTVKINNTSSVDYLLMKFAQESSGYADADGDGFGAGNAIALNCVAVPGLVLNNTDCNDANQNIFPGATDQCNGIDDDCDGIIDENLPNASITPLGNLDICLTGSVDLQANGGAGLSYQWLKNNNNIPGATNQIYTATTKGSYKVSVTASGNCTNISLKTKVTNSCKEGLDVIGDDELKAYPNPFSNSMRIDLSEMNWSKDHIEIQITDVSGKILFQKSFYNQNEIEIGSELPAGFYFVEVRGETFSTVIKVIKE